ncbi:signal peptidase I [Verrucomicrobiaceae bacterium R5-34]|uniref:Signal peptidase I n=1 Tax=Oceaniferula flava TaxID=2800421 RepID=A0AAE2SE04_9BACT|nr:signal peptidase I [Oceaniferula flavus]MBK1830491.1 signal peptidase I [Verrucomicrobiaceae bacterium R5-34]MBK1854586.1 signal peptidase I [Oceaniferula flavus]MBM1135892.1 signal peptidase I [Oceaniferula flavus]
MFAPKWKKEAKLLDKAAKKFLNYKRDLLEDKQIEEIHSRRSDLRAAVKSGNKDSCAEASKQLQATCESALPRYQAQGWVEENLEVFFVAIVVALGLRAYVVQPFRIPTGSMQPTLNGIVATPLPDDEQLPSMATRAIQKATHGRTYVDLVTDTTKVLRQNNPVIERPVFHFFTRTYIYFADGSKMSFPGPKSALLAQGEDGKGFGFAQTTGYVAAARLSPEQRAELRQAGVPFDGQPNQESAFYTNPMLAPDTKVAHGYIDSGDLILVDKMSYHFRNPSRGEVFVFDTREIQRIHSDARAQGTVAGSHYIKRLAAVPGDSLQIQGLDLYINGELASEPGFKKVMSQENGYRGYEPRERLAGKHHFKANFSTRPGMNEYIALGDNSFNSSDSRHWGTVKEFNVIGPASFTLWPFGSGHWGPIK